MKYTVIKPFKDIDGKIKVEGTKIDIDNDRAAKLRRYGLIGLCREKAVIKPQEKAVIEEEVCECEEYPLYLGGSWYLLSNGEKAQGKQNAIDLQNEINKS